jgi:hypothetical protein
MLMVRIRNFVLNMIGESIRAKLIFFSSLLFLLILSIIIIYSVWTYSLKCSREETIQLAMLAEAGFNEGILNELDLNESDLNKKTYQDIKYGLAQVGTAHKKIRFAYILVLKDGKVYFAADSEPADSKDYSPPGQEYTEASPIMYKAFESDEALIEHGPDRWGTWVTALVPMTDQKTGEVVALFGVDYYPEQWYRYAVESNTGRSHPIHRHSAVSGHDSDHPDQFCYPNGKKQAFRGQRKAAGGGGTPPHRI